MDQYGNFYVPLRDDTGGNIYSLVLFLKPIINCWCKRKKNVRISRYCGFTSSFIVLAFKIFTKIFRAPFFSCFLEVQNWKNIYCYQMYLYHPLHFFSHFGRTWFIFFPYVSTPIFHKSISVAPSQQIKKTKLKLLSWVSSSHLFIDLAICLSIYPFIFYFKPTESN